MRAPSSPPPTRGPAASGYATYANPNLRVSDAERAEVTDLLSKHYADGRLDEAEFSKRQDQAMNATTQSDLAGLFADLPGGEPPGTQPPGTDVPAAPDRRGPGRPGQPRRILALILLVVISIVIGHALAHLFIPWLLIAVLVFLWLRHGPRRDRGASGG